MEIGHVEDMVRRAEQPISPRHRLCRREERRGEAARISERLRGDSNVIDTRFQRDCSKIETRLRRDCDARGAEVEDGEAELSGGLDLVQGLSYQGTPRTEDDHLRQVGRGEQEARG